MTVPPKTTFRIWRTPNEPQVYDEYFAHKIDVLENGALVLMTASDVTMDNGQRGLGLSLSAAFARGEWLRFETLAHGTPEVRLSGRLGLNS